MNFEQLFSNPSSTANQQTVAGNSDNSQTGNPGSLTSLIPGGLAGGLAAGGVMALLMGSKSTRKMAKKVAKVGGTAVLGGLAYKAYDNWSQNKALGQTKPITDNDIQHSLVSMTAPTEVLPGTKLTDHLIMAMIAAAKSDGNFDQQEQRTLFTNIEKMDLSIEQKAAVFELMNREITASEVAAGVENDEHKAEIYLAAYLAIDVDDQRERSFLNNLVATLNLPKGFAAYLEQQADLGLET